MTMIFTRSACVLCVVGIVSNENFEVKERHAHTHTHTHTHTSPLSLSLPSLSPSLSSCVCVCVCVCNASQRVKHSERTNVDVRGVRVDDCVLWWREKHHGSAATPAAPTQSGWRSAERRVRPSQVGSQPEQPRSSDPNPKPTNPTSFQVGANRLGVGAIWSFGLGKVHAAQPERQSGKLLFSSCVPTPWV